MATINFLTWRRIPGLLLIGFTKSSLDNGVIFEEGRDFNFSTLFEDSGPCDVVMNFDGVNSMGMLFLAKVFSFQRKLKVDHYNLVLCNLGSDVLKTIRSRGRTIEKHVQIVADEETAMEFLIV